MMMVVVSVVLMLTVVVCVVLMLTVVVCVVQELEDKILKLLKEAKGNILDDEVLINTLNNSKLTAGMIQNRLREAEETEDSINQVHQPPLHLPLLHATQGVRIALAGFLLLQPCSCLVNLVSFEAIAAMVCLATAASASWMCQSLLRHQSVISQTPMQQLSPACCRSTQSRSG